MATRKEPLPVAVAGVGLHGENHVLAVADSPDTALTCVYDVDEGRARAIADKYGCRVAPTLDALLASEAEAVSVATPDHLHFDMAQALLEAGKHVLVEKPLATSESEGRALVDLASQKGLHLSVNFANRWNPRFLAVKEVLEEGGIGEPVLGYARISNSRSVPLEMLKWSARSGPEWFLLPHILDIVCWLLGGYPREVYARAVTGELKTAGVDVWDGFQVLAQFERAVVTFESCWLLPDTGPAVTDAWFELTGTAGRIRAENTYQGVEWTQGARGVLYPGTVPLGRRSYYGRASGHYYEAIQDFYRHIARGEPPTIPARDGWAITRVIAAIHGSHDAGHPIALRWS